MTGNAGHLWRRAAYASALVALPFIVGAATPAPAPAVPQQAQAAARPNILVIMADDIGYSDIGANGGEIDTPNLDALARRSVRFANFYNMSRCCPSRASLLTGRYPHRVGVGGNGTSLSRDVPTIAEELRADGYATTMVGKWHLTAANPLPDRAEHLKWINHQAYLDRDFGDRSTYPVARGFDHHYGTIWGVGDYYDPFSLVEDYTPVRSVPKDFYYTDAISDRAAREVDRLGQGQGRGRKPFMMYLAYTAAHWPIMAPEATIRKYLPRYVGGWDAMRQARYARQVKSGLVDPRTMPLPTVEQGVAHDNPGAWDELTPDQRAAQVRKMATHAAMVDIMDRGIGRVVARLKATGQYDNTVILFLSDNGASPEMPSNPGYDRNNGTRDGQTLSMGMYPDQPIGGRLSYTGIGSSWASAANTPWRYWKAQSYDGGIHTPFLISWPGHMAGREGRMVDTPGHVIDVTPTLLELAGLKPSVNAVPMDGISLAGVLAGRPVSREQPIFFEHYGARAVIDGRWKAVSLAPGRPRGYRPWALYDLAADRTEQRDVAATNPAVLAALDRRWSAWAAAVDVAGRGGRQIGAARRED